MTAEKATREGNMRQLCGRTNKMTGKYNKPQRPVTEKESKTMIENQKQKNIWGTFEYSSSIEPIRRKGKIRQRKNSIHTVGQYMELKTTVRRPISNSQSPIRISRQFYCTERKLQQQPQSSKWYKYE
ncbi:unnamed protein product [Schistosoma mattheei]|uniref:Uncharacterized protein n=1 Tax=Schistosoma mattheei TaxID=31246 RepID=A0A183P4R3_9TREM|nr:unnamed protein product [Schistosoma mattheei]